jgi:hypothetical protein
MAFGISAASWLAVAAVGSLAVSVYSMANQPKAPQMAAPPAMPQASQAPNAQGIARGMAGAGQAGGSPGVGQTMLTGAGGVDPNTLALGKNTLLGS